MVAQVEILAVDYTSSGQLSDVLKFEIINRIKPVARLIRGKEGMY